MRSLLLLAALVALPLGARADVDRGFGVWPDHCREAELIAVLRWGGDKTDVPGGLPTLRFELLEVLKGAARLGGRRRLAVREWCGYHRSKMGKGGYRLRPPVLPEPGQRVLAFLDQRDGGPFVLRRDAWSRPLAWIQPDARTIGLTRGCLRLRHDLRAPRRVKMGQPVMLRGRVWPTDGKPATFVPAHHRRLAFKQGRIALQHLDSRQPPAPIKIPAGGREVAFDLRRLYRVDPFDRPGRYRIVLKLPATGPQDCLVIDLDVER